MLAQQFGPSEILIQDDSDIIHLVQHIDMNNDGFIDFLYAVDSNLFWYKNNNGTYFEGPTLFHESEEPIQLLAVYDINNDGSEDIVVNNTQKIYVLFKSVFADILGNLDIVEGSFVSHLQVTDIDQDNQPEIFALEKAPGPFFNNGHVIHAEVLSETEIDGPFFSSQCANLTQNFYIAENHPDGPRLIRAQDRGCAQLWVDGYGVPEPLEIIYEPIQNHSSLSSTFCICDGSEVQSMEDLIPNLDFEYAVLDIYYYYDFHALDLDSDDFIELAVEVSLGTGLNISELDSIVTGIDLSPTYLNISSNRVKQIESADFNSDLINEILLLDKEGILYLTHSENGFTDYEIISIGSDLADATFDIADYDNNGLLDITVVKRNGKIILFKQFGEFQFESTSIGNSSFYKPQRMELIDVDEDGDEDLFAFYEAPLRLKYFENINGTFNENYDIAIGTANLLPPYYQYSPYTLEVADIDFDNDLDLVFYGNNRGLQVYAALNNGSQGIEDFQFAGVKQKSGQMHIIDIDYDGDLDFVSAFQDLQGDLWDEGNGIYWFENLGNGQFSDEEILLNTPNSTTIKIDFGDINNDSILDIVFQIKSFQYSNDYQIYCYVGTNEGFVEDALGLIESDGDYTWFFSKLEDFDEDNDLDIIGSMSGETIAFENDGLGAYSFVGEIETNEPGNPMGTDVNGDGIPDLLYNNQSVPSLGLSIGHNEHRFVPIEALAPSTTYKWLDKENDNRLDALVMDDQSKTLSLYPYQIQTPGTNFEFEMTCNSINTEINFHNTTWVHFPDCTLHWDFGDGSISSEIHPKHTYSEPGIYNINLEICNSISCVESIQEIFIMGIVPQWTAQATAFDEFTFLNSFSELLTTNWTWDFGDGNFSTASEPTHIYSEPGTYTVTVYTTNNELQDCTAVQTFEIEVLPNQGDHKSFDVFEITPNPVYDYLHINGDEIESFQIYNIGLQLIEPFLSSIPIDVSSLPSGLYIIEILKKDGNKEFTRFIKE